MRTYHVRYATTDRDLVDCLDLRAEAETWLADNNIAQWEIFETGRRVLTKAFEDGALYVVEDRVDDVNEIVGCLRLDGPDQDFWQPHEAAQPALYLYKLIITGGYRGTGLGDAIMDWASHRAWQHGAKWLRMDCRKDNIGLQRYYLDRGFTHVDTRHREGRESGWLGQRDVYTRTGPQDVRLVDEANVNGGAVPFVPGQRYRYDPTGTAALWQTAANLVCDLKTDEPPVSPTAWNDALDQASRVLERHGIEEKQAQGMYYRPLLGNNA